MANPICHAKRSNGESCRNPSMDGQQVCRKHGGSSPQAKAAAAQRVAITQAEGLLTKHGAVEAISDPLHELLMIGGRCKRLVATLEEKVDELTSIRYENVAGGEMLRAEISAYMTMLDRSRATLVDIIKLDIWDRLAKVEERQVALLAVALEHGLADAGIDAEKAAEVKGNVARHLRVAAS